MGGFDSSLEKIKQCFASAYEISNNTKKSGYQQSKALNFIHDSLSAFSFILIWHTSFILH